MLLGLLFGGLITLFSLALGGAAAAASDRPGGAMVGMLFGAAAVVVLPIFYGCLMFIMTLIQAALFNVAAKWAGGVEIDAS